MVNFDKEGGRQESGKGGGGYSRLPSSEHLPSSE